VLRVDVASGQTHEEQGGEPVNHAAEIMTLYCPKREASYDVPVAMPSSERIDEIQQQLSELLIADAE